MTLIVPDIGMKKIKKKKKKNRSEISNLTVDRFSSTFDNLLLA